MIQSIRNRIILRISFKLLVDVRLRTLCRLSLTNSNCRFRVNLTQLGTAASGDEEFLCRRNTTNIGIEPAALVSIEARIL